MKTELVIFDMDGTLVDSELCSAQALVDVLPPNFAIDATEMLDKFRGVRTADILAELAEQFGPVDVDATISHFRVRENELALELISLNPGVVPLLDALQEMALPYCIASNAPVEKTIRSLQLCGVERYFDTNVFSAYQVNAWKPDPQLFLHAAQSQGVVPPKCIVVEDSEVGLQAAIAAGMQAVFYCPTMMPDTGHDFSGLASSSPDIVSISELGQLLEHIDTN